MALLAEGGPFYYSISINIDLLTEVPMAEGGPFYYSISINIDLLTEVLEDLIERYPEDLTLC